MRFHFFICQIFKLANNKIVYGFKKLNAYQTDEQQIKAMKNMYGEFFHQPLKHQIGNEISYRRITWDKK